MSDPSVVLIAAKHRGWSVCARNPTLKHSQALKEESWGMGEGDGGSFGGCTGQGGAQKCVCVG